ncbi:MAG TPA: helix-hairpin-helix domain-containing protein [Chloroflexia bacterium]|nr:helix-hairpin-helix domain-containing protein [Chloroflexia bacterium]
MKAKQALQRRILLSRVLLAFSIVPAVGIAVWLFLVKAPPGDAVLIVDTSDLGPLLGGRTPTGVVTSASPIVPNSSPTERANSGKGSPQPTPIQAQLAGAGSTPVTFQSDIMPSPIIERITVYVSGAVNKPGVYTLDAASRVADAVNLAGGMSPEADIERINLAARIVDEEHISVPVKGAPTVIGNSTPTHSTARATARPGVPPTIAPNVVKVNINIATAQELELLPGIGPALATRIVEYRAANGNFSTVEDLTRVPGIKSGLLDRIRDYVTVGP